MFLSLCLAAILWCLAVSATLFLCINCLSALCIVLIVYLCVCVLLPSADSCQAFPLLHAHPAMPGGFLPGVPSTLR